MDIFVFCISIFTQGMLLADLRHNAPLSLRGTFVFGGCSLQLLHICTLYIYVETSYSLQLLHMCKYTVHTHSTQWSCSLQLLHICTVEKSLYTVHSGEQLLTATFGPHQITLRPYSAQLSAPGTTFCTAPFILHFAWLLARCLKPRFHF